MRNRNLSIQSIIFIIVCYLILAFAIKVSHAIRNNIEDDREYVISVDTPLVYVSQYERPIFVMPSFYTERIGFLKSRIRWDSIRIELYRSKDIGMQQEIRIDTGKYTRSQLREMQREMKNFVFISFRYKKWFNMKDSYSLDNRDGGWINRRDLDSAEIGLLEYIRHIKYDEYAAHPTFYYNNR